MRFRLLILLVAAVLPPALILPIACADTHWANINGSNIPPYTSYASGAHQIQDAIDEAVAGDTVRIAAGKYDVDTTILLSDYLTIRGAGKDSTVIAPTNDDFLNIFELSSHTGNGNGGTTLEECEISGFFETYHGSGPSHFGVFIGNQHTSPNKIHNNQFYYLDEAVVLTDAVVEVVENEFDSTHFAIQISFGYWYDIHDNQILGWPLTHQNPPSTAWGISTPIPIFDGTVKVHNNVVYTNQYAMSFAFYGDSLIFDNNLVVTQYGRVLHYICDNVGICRNNTIIRTSSEKDRALADFVLAPTSDMIVENNIFQGLDGLVTLRTQQTSKGHLQFFYNNLWGLDSATDTLVGLKYPPDISIELIGNLNRNPMVTPDSAYRLQRGSPLIDAGDPTILDLDGTCSDIGWTGGPGGISYTYPEEPPERPDTLLVVLDQDTLRLSWPPNSEADLGAYHVYRDSFSGFIPGSSNLLAALNVPDTTYADYIGSTSGELYYVVTAIDTADFESSPSKEVLVLGTGIFEELEVAQDQKQGELHVEISPNPFNSSTTIKYYIPDISARPVDVGLYIYDVLGRKVVTIVDERLYPGQHHTTWDGRTACGIPAASGVYFVKLTIWGYEFASSAKLILQK